MAHSTGGAGFLCTQEDSRFVSSEDGHIIIFVWKSNELESELESILKRQKAATITCIKKEIAPCTRPVCAIFIRLIV